ncbi:MAG: putative RNase H-like HicB family nuclease [Rhodothermales bacterium]|jgi:predicted RNase H-like HicB family nuclease
MEYGVGMKTIRYVHWEDDGAWLGYIEEYPDYWTQGESLKDLEEHLRDLLADLESGEIPGIRRVAELVLA